VGTSSRTLTAPVLENSNAIVDAVFVEYY